MYLQVQLFVPWGVCEAPVVPKWPNTRQLYKLCCINVGRPTYFTSLLINLTWNLKLGNFARYVITLWVCPWKS